MKINYRKLAQVARWGYYTLFGAIAALGTVAISLGYYQHVITTSGCLAMIYAARKNW